MRGYNDAGNGSREEEGMQENAILKVTGSMGEIFQIKHQMTTNL